MESESYKLILYKNNKKNIGWELESHSKARVNEYQMMKNNINIPPGLLQYRLNKNDIISFDINNKKTKNIDYKNGWELESHTKDNLLRLIPDTKTGNSNNWKILLIIKRIQDKKICIKGALQNTRTHEFALMSSINEYYTEYKYNTINSHDKKWKICRCKMIAPLFFWDELKNRLLY